MRQRREALLSAALSAPSEARIDHRLQRIDNEIGGDEDHRQEQDGPCNAGMSRLMMAFDNIELLPGQVNTVSTRTEPLIR